MGILIGPTPWWQQNVVSAVPVGPHYLMEVDLFVRPVEQRGLLPQYQLRSMQPGITLQTLV